MLKINQRTCLRWIRDNYDRFRMGTEDEELFRFQECHVCGHAKWAVRFNARSQRVICFRCGSRTQFVDLVGHYLGTTNMIEIIRHLKTYGELSLQWEAWSNDIEPEDALKVLLDKLEPKRKDEPGALDLSHFSTDWTTDVGLRILEYARARNVPEVLIQSGRVGYFRKGSLVGRLSFLIYENRVPVFAVARAIRPGVTPKYLYPPQHECGGRGAAFVVYNLDLVPPGSVMPLAEGVLSAISAGPTATAMLGSTLSEVQASKIRATNPAAVFLLREQNIDPSHAEWSARRLWSKDIPAFIADLVDGDTNDNPDQLPDVIDAAREANDLTLLKSKLGLFSS